MANSANNRMRSVVRVGCASGLRKVGAAGSKRKGGRRKKRRYFKILLLKLVDLV